MTTRALTDEAAAFLAEALFHVYDTTATGIAPQTPYWATGSGIAGLAHGVAVRISNQQGAAVDGQYAKALRDAVMKHPAYKSFKKDPKGDLRK